MICERCHQRYWYPGETGPPSNTVGPETSAPAIADAPTDTAAAGPTGTIEGHIRLAGDPPGNSVIRMGVDPLCSQLTEGKLMVQESVLTSPDESLANVFVRLEGTFPETPVPEEPVVIDQTDCVFVPRVVGARTGQLVQIKNNDPLLHNLNSQSTSNRFNVGQPMQGMVDAPPESERAVQIGRPSADIVGYADEHDIDMIVIGTHCQGPIRQMLLGSVADKVVRSAHCPVLTVRPSAHDAA